MCIYIYTSNCIHTYIIIWCILSSIAVSDISRLSSHTLTQSWHGCYCVGDYQSHPVQVEPQLLSAQNRTETRWIQSANALVTKVLLSQNESLNCEKTTQLPSCQPVIFWPHFCQKTNKNFNKFWCGQCQPPHDRRSVPTQPLEGIDFTWAVIHPTTCVVSWKIRWNKRDVFLVFHRQMRR